MINKITHAALEKLINQNLSPTISIYMPTHKNAAPPNVREDQTRFKNLVAETDRIMRAQGVEADLQAGILDRLNKLIDDQEFWQRQTDGLALFINPKTLTYFNLPVSTDEYVAVDSHYHLAPLFALEQDNQAYYLLALARQEPCLFKGDMYGLEEVAIELPKSIEEALNIDEMSQRQQHYHGGAGGFATGQNAGSNSKDAGDQERLRFFRLVDEQLRPAVDTNLPLVLAGVSSDVAEFRSVSKHPNIVEQSVNGNHKQKDLPQMHNLAWDVIRNLVIDNRYESARTSFEELKAQNRSVAAPPAILDAAEKGRVDTLMISMFAETHDTVSDDMRERPKIVFPRDNLKSLLDYCALLTWSQGGKVLNLAQELLPARNRMAAILRY